jgi:hypothetical protein
MSGRGGLQFPRNQDVLDDSLDARYRDIVGLTDMKTPRMREREKKRRFCGCFVWLSEFFGKRNLENLSIICTILSARAKE